MMTLWKRTRLAVLAPLAVVAALLVMSCGGGGTSAATAGANPASSGGPSPSATQDATNATSTPVTATASPTRAPVAQPSSIASWAGGVCGAARVFKESSNSFSAEINRLDFAAPTARQQVLNLYGQFADDLSKYRSAVGALQLPPEPGGAEARQVWLDDLQVAIDRNAILIARVTSLDAATFAKTYPDLITDFRDEFSQQNVRLDLEALIPRFPLVQSVIDTVDNTPSCAAATFEG